MNFTESLTELLRPELFPKLPKQLLGLLNLLCHSAANRDSYETLRASSKQTPSSRDEKE